MAIKCFVYGIVPMGINSTNTKYTIMPANNVAHVYDSSTGEAPWSPSQSGAIAFSVRPDQVEVSYGDTLSSMRNKLIQAMLLNAAEDFPGEINLSNVNFVWLDDRGLL